MHITLDIDDNDRFEEGAEETPWSLRMTTDATQKEFIEIGSETALIGEDIPTMLRELADLWPGSQSTRNELATLDLSIENAYADGIIHTVVNSVIVPMPTDLGEDALSTWAFDHLTKYTGTGEERSGDDAIYSIEVIGSSDATLQGRIFTIGG